MKKFWLSLATLMITFSWASVAFAATGGGSNSGWAAAIGAGIAIALAAFGGAVGQGNATASAVEGIARNPGARGQLFVPLILGLVLIESLVIYAFVIALMLTGKV
ncbi:MAG: ATP synthase F0 subunit C [Deltaproteobacteria bacterium]|nr:MAG: ATP synthase F0 subunit C [Deltaproteobacteria bacterium]